MRGLLAPILLLLSAQALAEPAIVVSKAPETVAVTFYRDSQRGPSKQIEIDPGYDDEILGGYVLVDEVREVDLPPGEVTVRFEGVASGIVPQSAILFDAELTEKNFDSRLLSQRGLIDAFTGQRVTIRRTDPATGAATTEKGTIVSQPDALVLKTDAGYEAVQCDGGFNTLLYPGVPLDLTAKPTLSLLTRPDQKGGKARLHLAYIAGNFDWQANYVGTFSPDARVLKLMGWMTLASKDRTTFADAEASAVAGMVARAESKEEWEDAIQREREDDPYAEDNIEIGMGCWPTGRTSPSGGRGQLFTPGSLPTIEAPVAVRLDDDYFVGSGGCSDDGACDDIIVTARRRSEVADLGDLKLYTVTRPTTVAAMSIKQVRFLEEKAVKGEAVYRARFRFDDLDEAGLVYRFRNTKEDGLGEPLPQGRMALFQQSRLGRQLVGELGIMDKAVGEDVDLLLPEESTPDIVDFDIDEVDSGENWTRREITVTNEGKDKVLAEVEFFDTAEYRYAGFSRSTFRRDGAQVWRIEVPGEGERKIAFRSTQYPDPMDE